MQEGNLIPCGPFDPRASDDERRATNQVLLFWRNARKSKSLPALVDLDLSTTQDADSSWFLLKEDSDPHLSVFIQCGGRAENSLATTKPQGLTLWDAVPIALRANLCRACAKAVVEQAPCEADGVIEITDGGEFRYRSIFMPVGATASAGNGGKHGYIFGAISSKQVTSNEAELG
jgi:hypothetical protein